MDFDRVNGCLVDIFPQFDPYILESIAIENSNDVDEAVEVFLDIFPDLPTRTVAFDFPLQEKSAETQSNVGVKIGETSNQSRYEQVSTVSKVSEGVMNTNLTNAASNADSVKAPQSSDSESDMESDELVLFCESLGKDCIANAKLNSLVHEDVERAKCSNLYFDCTVKTGETNNHSSCEQVCTVSKACEGLLDAALTKATCNADSSKVPQSSASDSNMESDELALFFKSLERKNISNASMNSLVHEDVERAEQFQVCPSMTASKELDSQEKSLDGSGKFVSAGCRLLQRNTDCDGNSSSELIDINQPAYLCRKGSANSSIFGTENMEGHWSFTEEHAPDALRSILHLESDLTEFQKHEEHETVNRNFKKQLASKMEDAENESTLNADMLSSQVWRTDFLDEIIEYATNDMKALCLAMELVMNSMTEVEFQEKAVEQMKGEAAKGGFLAKVEELKCLLARAKEANDMHAGEVYGEKAILATEAREFQNRIDSLSEERDKSLAILDEMRRALKNWQAAAEKGKLTAEKEKLEKEESANSTVTELEATVEMVVQESKRLQREAEENSKLRMFLVDRGHIVDSLQGEMSVLCHNVRLLKEKFDEHVPLSKSTLSSQTSCILASSISFLKNMQSDTVSEQGETSKTGGRSVTSPLELEPRLERDGFRTDEKELIENGWDLLK